MRNDLDSVIDPIRMVVEAGIQVGRLWHRAIEAANHRIDRWLWDQDWAWANNRGYS